MHADQRIDSLSGGQRKRVNVAVELISSPRLILLDEPTSGLDYHSENSLVTGLRRLSRQGRTVVFVTHALATLSAADHVIVLHNDGEGARVFVEGPHDAVAGQLQARKFPSDQAITPEHQRSPGPWLCFLGRLPRLATLTLRYTRQWLSSPLTTLTSLLLLPLVLGVLVRLAVTADGRLGTDRILFGLIASFWLGMNQSVREIARERDAFLREHAVRVGAMSVLLSKLFFFLAVSLPQAILLSAPLKWLGVEQWTVTLGTDELNCPWLLLILMFWFSDLIGCVVGLLISAGCLFFRQKGEVVAVLLVILFTLPQILFSSKIIPEGFTKEEHHFHSFTLWHDSSAIPELLSFFTVTRYLFLPLDAVSRDVAAQGKIFAFNVTVLMMFLGVTVVSTWLIMEAYVQWQRRFQ